jgi:two-component system, NtrC family, nitrogen regulation response regulator GlnG
MPVWIIDDDKAIRWVLEKALARSAIDYRSFASADDAQAALADEVPQAMICDIRMPGIDGLKFLSRVKQDHPLLPVIIMTAHADLDSAVSAFQGGAFEYLPKPFDIDQAVELIERALAENRQTASQNVAPEALPALLGQAPAMQDVFRAIGRLSQSTVTVLITGESGTGKERVAEALHQHSLRAGRPFIALNTAAIPKDLLESELFGHEKGAFTGAQATRRGRFEEAEGGTLFLDEIGDMPTELQTRLLRVLSDGHFYRVGGHMPIKANVRVIAATHQNLEERVHQGLFREDLFHRLNVIRLRLPPLRERSEDIPLLTRHFLAKSAASLGVDPKRLSPAAMQCIVDYDYPGNVRQLENLCQWITVMAPGQTVEVSDLPPELKTPPARATALPVRHEADIAPTVVKAGLEEDWTRGLSSEIARRLQAGESGIIDDLTHRFEACCILASLSHTAGRKIEAAQLLGWGRNTLTRKIQELGL